jgi:beta-glucosidase
MTVKYFLRYIKKIVSELKHLVDYWITINEPVGTYLGAGYMLGIWSPGFVLDGQRAKTVLHNLIVAHVKAYDIITTLDNVDADGDGIAKAVGFSHAMMFVRPANTSNLLESVTNINGEAAKNFDYFANDYFLNAVVNGEEDLNYLETVMRHNVSSPDFKVHDEWKNKVDFIGVNYYRAVHVKFNLVLAMLPLRFVGGLPLDLVKSGQSHGILSDLGWEIFPTGLYELIMRISKRYNKPVLITENGIADKGGLSRARYIVSHLQQVKRALDSGANVIGYIHWSLLDNFEWHENYSPHARFGLLSVNRSNHFLGRNPTLGAAALKLIISESNGEIVKDNALVKAAKTFGTFSPDGSARINPCEV